MGVSWLKLYSSFYIVVSLFLLLVYSLDAEIVTVDIHAANDLIYRSGYGVIDVRTVEEFNNGHVDSKKIINIPYMFDTPEGRVKNPQFLSEVSVLCNKEDKFVVGCRSGVRSLAATEDLQNIGFKHVSNMGGGYVAWVKDGLPTKKPEEHVLV